MKAGKIIAIHRMLDLKKKKSIAGKDKQLNIPTVHYLAAVYSVGRCPPLLFLGMETSCLPTYLTQKYCI